jgi:hypothetical protein
MAGTSNARAPSPFLVTSPHITLDAIKRGPERLPKAGGGGM